MISIFCLTICILHYILEHTFGNNGPNRLTENEHDGSGDLWLAQGLADRDQVGSAQDAGDVADISSSLRQDPFWAAQEDDSSDDDMMGMYYDDDEGSVSSTDSGLHLADAPVDFLTDGQEYIARLMLNEGLMPENWDEEEESI